MKSSVRILASVISTVFVLVLHSAECADDDNNISEQQQCGLYLAISSTSTDAEPKWGLFAGKDIPPQTPIGYTDIGILSHDLRIHSSLVDEDDENVQVHMEEFAEFFESFFWSPDTIGAHHELKSTTDMAAIPGFGALSQYNPELTNADWNKTAAYRRIVLGDSPGVTHPGRGATTTFFNAQVVSMTEISAGTEIFIDYGEGFAEEEVSAGEITKEDYSKIDHVVNHMINFFEKHKDVLTEESKNVVFKFITGDVLKAAAGESKARRISKLLPTNPDELMRIQESGGSLAFSDPTVYRTMKWLNENGICVDHIRPGTSTISYAGRGAFSNRRIKQGSLVAPIPLIPIPDKRFLNMYKLSINNKEYVKESNKPVATQLLHNYCYGHPQSNMLFFPVGPVVGLINHSDKPNAKLVWSNNSNNQKSWFEVNPNDLINEEYQYIGLLMEVVATRDIEEGEEVLIDYGPEWKLAWEKHTNEWKTRIEQGVISSQWPLKAVDMNEKYSKTPFETDDVLQDPYPENVVLSAFIMIKDPKKDSSVEDPMIWENDKDNTAFKWDHLYPVRVLRRTKLEDNDTNDAVPYSYTLGLIVHKHNTNLIVAEVPHNALVFIDKPGTSDQFFPYSFRHYIGIPDEIFPQGVWRNLS